MKRRRRLKAIAVPSLNLPQRSTEVRRIDPGLAASRAARVERRGNTTAETCTDSDTVPAVGHVAEDCPHDDLDPPELSEDEALGELRNHIGIQTDFGEKGFFDIMLLIESEPALSVLTGIPSLDILDTLEKHVQIRLPKNKNIRKRIVLTLMRLKVGLSLTCLAVLFRCDRSHCSKMFSSTIVALADVLREVVDWPSKDEIRNWMPKSFRNFLKTRVILDCAEVPVEKPQCLICRVRTYSHYYGEHTLKFMVGCAPSGSISFLSKAYGGRVSDKQICRESGVLEKLEPYVDAVMVDKGFMIEDLCEERAVGLIRPPFLRNKTQFSEEEAKMTAEIARARVHVERAIQRLKLYSVLKQKIPWTLLPYANSIIVVIGGITNLCNPIIGDDSF